MNPRMPDRASVLKDMFRDLRATTRCLTGLRFLSVAALLVASFFWWKELAADFGPKVAGHVAMGLMIARFWLKD